MGTVKTRYKISGGDLLKDDHPTGIKVTDDYFFRGSEPLDIYLEDGHIFVLIKIIPFLKALKISSSAKLRVDPEGIVWGSGKDCIFDKLTS